MKLIPLSIISFFLLSLNNNDANPCLQTKHINKLIQFLECKGNEQEARLLEKDMRNPNFKQCPIEDTLILKSENFEIYAWQRYDGWYSHKRNYYFYYKSKYSFITISEYQNFEMVREQIVDCILMDNVCKIFIDINAINMAIEPFVKSNSYSPIKFRDKD